MKKAILLTLLASYFTYSTIYAITYTRYGDTVYDDEGNSYTQYGDTIYGSNGTSYTQSGDTYYANNGQTYTRYLDTVYRSDGTFYYEDHNTTHGSDGSSGSYYDYTLYVNESDDASDDSNAYYIQSMFR